MESDTGHGPFPQTRWTLLIQAKDLEGPDCKKALDELIRAYWKPVYAYMRRRGISRESAADLTQEYFAGFLEHDIVRQFDREKGRFKTFVLATVKHFLSNQQRRNQAQKRGGGVLQISEVEVSLQDSEDPETAFNRNWAECVLEQALERLDPQDRRFLTEYLATSNRVNYKDLAQKMGCSEAEVRNSLRRVRRTLRAILLEVLKADAESARDVEAEMQELFLSL